MYFLIRLFIYMLPSGKLRTKWIKKFKIFKKTGDNFYFCPRKLPADPKLIKFGNNVAVATEVMFINHDVYQKVYNNLFSDDMPKYFGCIDIGNNVFIGARVIILPNVKICDNVFIAAGALVTKSILKPGIWGGIPARYIGDIESLCKKRRDYKEKIYSNNNEELIKNLWDNLYKET